MLGFFSNTLPCSVTLGTLSGSMALSFKRIGYQYAPSMWMVSVCVCVCVWAGLTPPLYRWLPRRLWLPTRGSAGEDNSVCELCRNTMIVCIASKTIYCIWTIYCICFVLVVYMYYR